MTELVVIAVIALFVLGPEEMVRQSKRLGKFAAKLRTQANNFKVMMEAELDAPPKKVVEESKVEADTIVIKDQDSNVH